MRTKLGKRSRTCAGRRDTATEDPQNVRVRTNPTVPQSQPGTPGLPRPLPAEQAEAGTPTFPEARPSSPRHRGQGRCRAGAPPPHTRRPEGPRAAPPLPPRGMGGLAAAPHSGALVRPLAGNAPGSSRRCSLPGLGPWNAKCFRDGGAMAPPGGGLELRRPPHSPGW